MYPFVLEPNVHADVFQVSDGFEKVDRVPRKAADRLNQHDIVKDRRMQNLYHVATRHFEAPEVKLLIDAVQSARFITPRKSKALVKRLSSFVAPGDTALLKRHLYIDSRSKATNESIYLNVDRIQTAITERKKISFCYFDYSPSKERVLRHGGQVYSVSPFAMLWNNDTYYLVGFHDHRQQIAKFRVDRIVQMEVTDEAAVRKPKGFDVSEFFTQEFSMLNGKECMVTLLCENILMNSIIQGGDSEHIGLRASAPDEIRIGGSVNPRRIHDNRA